MDEKIADLFISRIPEIETSLERYRKFTPETSEFGVLAYFAIHAFMKRDDPRIPGPIYEDFDDLLSRVFSVLESILVSGDSTRESEINEHFVNTLFLVAPEMFEEIRSYAGPSMKRMFDQRIDKSPDWIEIMKEADQEDLPFEEDDDWAGG